MMPDICLNFPGHAICTLRDHCDGAVDFTFLFCPTKPGKAHPPTLSMTTMTLNFVTPPGTAPEAVLYYLCTQLSPSMHSFLWLFQSTTI